MRVDDTLSFTLRELFDPVRLTVSGLPRGWVVKSVRYRGEDITDVATEFVTDPRHQIEVTLTSRVATVTGTVSDDSGRPVTGARVFLLPADPKQWSDELYRYVQARPTKGGQFTTPTVRAGDYLIVAIADDQSVALQGLRPTIERLAKHAERISLTENDRLTMNLRLVTLPDVK